MKGLSFGWQALWCAVALLVPACAPAEPDTRGSAQLQALLRADPKARVLSGAVHDAHLRPMLERLGLEILPAGFAWQSRRFESASDAVLAVLPDPEQPGLPLTLVACNDAACVPADIAPCWRNGVQLLRGPLVELEAPLDAQGRIDAARAQALAVPRTGSQSALADAALAKAGELLGEKLPPVPLLVFESLLDQTPHIGTTHSARYDARSATALGVEGDELACAAVRGALEQAWGRPANAWLADGLALLSAQRFDGRPLELVWSELARLALPDPRAIASPEALERFSPRIVHPLRAWLAAGWLQSQRLQSQGAAGLRAQWGAAWTGLPDAWALPTPQPLPAREALPRGLRGVACAGPADAQSLQLARQLGANAVSLRASFACEYPPHARPQLESEPALRTLEGDAALSESIRNARALGLRVWLEVQVLRQPSSGLLGDQPPTGVAEWDAIFHRLGARLEHIALLAQSCGAETLVIGSDLGGISRATPYGARALPGEAELRVRGWQQLEQRVRAAFDGWVTYSSSSFVELPDLALGDRLDAIGLRLSLARPDSKTGTRAQQRDALVQAARNWLLPVGELARSRSQPWWVISAAGESAENMELHAVALRSLPESARPHAVFLGRWPLSLSEAPRSPRDPLIADETRRATLAKIFQLL